jgi:20S proteasome alpha/beta subunit
MTIALGILARDGVVIAADTQEGGGYPGGMKTSGYKILSRIIQSVSPPVDRSFAVTGAGSAGYLDALNQEFADVFHREHEPKKIEAAFRDSTHDFYHRHMLPLHVLPESRQPFADWIIGVTWSGLRGKPSLFATEHSTLRRCKGFVAAGAGREHASMLLSRVIPRSGLMPVERAAYLAAYVVFHVKEHIEGCGKHTHVVVLQNGHGEYLSPETIAALEYRFNNYLDFDALAINYILGRPVKDEQIALTHLSNYLRGIRADTLELPRISTESQRWSLDWDESIPPRPSGLKPLDAPIESTSAPTPSGPRRRKKS